MKVAVTCIQLLRDIAEWQSELERAGVELVLPTIPGQHLDGDELVAALRGCIGVIAGDDRFSRDVLVALPNLRVISKWGSGVDGIDHAAAAELGIAVNNTPGMFDNEVADVTMAYVVMLARHLVAINSGVHAGSWPKPAGTSLSDSTLGIIGLGGIGRAVAKRALAANMAVVGCDPSETSRAAARQIGVSVVDLDELLADSDFISVNCPLTPETFHLIDAATLARTKPGVRLVNTGRGAVVKTADLVAALDDGTVAGVALDVMEDEPLGGDHPLAGRPNVILGSHNASNTLEASARVHRLAVANLVAALAGRGT